MAKKKAAPATDEGKRLQRKIRRKAIRRAGSAKAADSKRKAVQKAARRDLSNRRARMGVVSGGTRNAARDLSTTRSKGKSNSNSLGRQLRRATQSGDTKKAAQIRKKISDRLVKKGLATRNSKGAAVLNRTGRPTRKSAASASDG